MPPEIQLETLNCAFTHRSLVDCCQAYCTAHTAFKSHWLTPHISKYSCVRYRMSNQHRFFSQEMRKMGFTDIDGTVVCVPESSSSCRSRRFRSRKREMVAKRLIASPKHVPNACEPSRGRRRGTTDFVYLTASMADNHSRSRCLSNPPPSIQEIRGDRDGAVRGSFVGVPSSKGCPNALRNTGLPPAPTWLPLASRDQSNFLGTLDVLTRQRFNTYSGPISGGDGDGDGGSTTAIASPSPSSVRGRDRGGSEGGAQKKERKKKDRSVYDRLSILTDSAMPIKVERTDCYLCSPVGRRDTDQCGRGFTTGIAGSAGAVGRSRSMVTQFASFVPPPGFGRLLPDFAHSPRTTRRNSASDLKNKSCGVGASMDPAVASRTFFNAISPRVQMAVTMSPLGNSSGGGGKVGPTSLGGQGMLDVTFFGRFFTGITGGGGNGGSKKSRGRFELEKLRCNAHSNGGTCAS